MIMNLFQSDQQREAALELYSDIVIQARQPEFYSNLGVPDTKEGRFDLITLHMFMVLRRLKQEPDKAGRFGQKLFDIMFKNMDHSLREMGVGDLTVGKKVRGLAEAFYGRVGVYETALDANDNQALRSALARNIYGSEDVNEPEFSKLVEYVHAATERLGQQSVERLMLGVVSFPEVGIDTGEILMESGL